MTIVVRFVYRSGFIRDRFLDFVYVKDTISLALKNMICSIYLVIILTLKISKVNGIMELVTCMRSGMDYRHYFLNIVLLHFMRIV